MHELLLRSAGGLVTFGIPVLHWLLAGRAAQGQVNTSCWDTTGYTGYTMPSVRPPARAAESLPHCEELLLIFAERVC